MDLVDRLDHVHRNADRACLVGDGPCDRLTNPPRRIGRKLEPFGVVELLDRPHEAQVALLHQVEQRHTPPGVAFGDRHDQAQVGLGEGGLGLLAVSTGALQRHALLPAKSILAPFGRHFGESLIGFEPSLDALGQRDFFGAIDQGHLADLAQVEPDRVARTPRLARR